MYRYSNAHTYKLGHAVGCTVEYYLLQVVVVEAAVEEGGGHWHV